MAPLCRASVTLFALALLVAAPRAEAQATDCNQNGVPDDEDVASGASPDCNGNLVPDECEVDTTYLLDDFDGSPLPPGVARTTSGHCNFVDCCPPQGACGNGGSFAYFGHCEPPWPCSIATIDGWWRLNYDGLALPARPIDAKVSFCYAMQCTTDPHEYAALYVDGAPVDGLHDEHLTLPWSKHVTDLSAHAGRTVQLGFWFYHSDGLGLGRGWHVDSIRIGNPGNESDCDANGTLDSCDIAADPALDLDGDGVLDACQCQVESYCLGAPNSVGAGARLHHLGGTSVAANDFGLRAEGAPPGQLGLYFYGPVEAQVPFGDGWLCVGTGGLGLFRLTPALAVAPDGSIERALDLTQPPASGGAGAIAAGSTWRFQLWYRDPAAGNANFNLSDALRAAFCR